MAGVCLVQEATIQNVSTVPLKNSDTAIVHIKDSTEQYLKGQLCQSQYIPKRNCCAGSLISLTSLYLLHQLPYLRKKQILVMILRGSCKRPKKHQYIVCTPIKHRKRTLYYATAKTAPPI